MRPTAVVARWSHPRLTLLVVLGIGLLSLGILLAVGDALLGMSLDVLGFRVGFVGFLLLVFGVAGHVAIGVFEGHPRR